MSSQATADGVLNLTVTFKIGTDVDLAQVQVQNRVSQALPRLPEEVRQIGVTTVKSSPNLTMVVHLVSPDKRYDELYLRNYAVLQVKDGLARIPGRGPGAGVRRRRLRHAHLARPAADRGPRPHRRRRRRRHPRAERPGRGRRRGRVAHAGQGRLPAERQRARPPHQRGGVRRHRHQDRRERRAHPAQGRGPHRARGRQLFAALDAEQQAGRRHRHLPGAGLERPAALQRRARRPWRRSRRRFPRAWTTASSTTPPSSCASRSTRSSRRCSRRSCSWSSSWCCSSRPGARRSSRWWRCRSRSSAPSPCC